jgi:hypothetical protein
MGRQKMLNKMAATIPQASSHRMCLAVKVPDEYCSGKWIGCQKTPDLTPLSFSLWLCIMVENSLCVSHTTIERGHAGNILERSRLPLGDLSRC